MHSLRMRRNSYTLLYIIVWGALMLTACQESTIYNRYLHTNVKGWERNDTLRFVIPPIKQSGRYTEEVGLRTNGDFPFTDLTLIIEQTKVKAGIKRLDTLACTLMNEQGHVEGAGISLYQYTFPLATLELDQEEELHIAVRHDMKREMLPGITDIGIRIEKAK